ncbi:DUF885 domain-containing protein [Caulobacter sp. KR2-114]|uniref:DUF885 domain-containing protein n=1 Tax=Caulobacter sp. KR2-114 TaxID=3400912 RepID=UPI003C0455E6
MIQFPHRRAVLGLFAATALPAGALAQGLSLPSGGEGRHELEWLRIAHEWLDTADRLSPVGATQIGDHRFDAELDDLSAPARASGVAELRGLLARIEALPQAELPRPMQIDAAILANQIRYDLWTDETLQSWAWDPLIYTGLTGDALYGLLARDYAPAPQRLAAAVSRMEKLPRLLDQARANLDPARTPRVHAETAVRQNKGVLGLVGELIAPHVGDLPPDVRARFTVASEALTRAVTAHQAWLETSLVPNARGDFRLGQALYDQKLAFALNTPLTRQEIRHRAETALAETRAEMYRLASRILAGRTGAPPTPDKPSADQQQVAIRFALDLAAEDRPARDGVVPFARQALAEATDFVKAHDLITLPAAPVQVIVMPEFKRGVAVAYCDPPGPLDKGQPTFYAISPIPDDWSAERTTSFLREYNRRGIRDIATHEAMPGHYVQLAHSNAYPSVLRSVLWSGAFVEGWAVYAEGMMADEGFGDPLYRLVVLKTRLRSITNAILDQAIHVDGMTREAAMTLMMRDAFQEEGEAAGKWIRASVSSAQLPSYFVGFSQHTAIRREAERRWGADFSLKRYHDAVLSFGSPPAHLARAALFDEPL